MKVEIGKQVQPVCITLETQGEIDLFASLINALPCGIAEEFNVRSSLIYNLACVLEQNASPTLKTISTISIIEY